MEVLYNGKLINNNDFLKVSETQIEPEIKLNLNPSNLYTLVLYDPDAVGGTYIHWVITNITNNNIKSGNIIIPYKGPAPPPKSGKHRYIFNLYKQNRVNNSEEINERQISIDNLREKFKISNPIYITQFISENESGGRKYRTKKKKTNKKRKRALVKKSRKIYY
jgi:phosphatidylethanolamine-binding protein (PEBP) family uncharacterized protein